MIEAAKIWNEPNNKSHWDPEIDPDWSRFAQTAILAGEAIKAANPDLPRVLGGISPIDPYFMGRMRDYGVLDSVDVVAVHGFPLDWNLWQIGEWPAKLEEIRPVVGDKPIWVTEVGVSSFGAEEVQAWGVKRTAELLIGKAPRVHWYSLYDLPRSWEATTRHREAEGSSYYRHFYMGLLREDGSPKPSLDEYAKVAGEKGLCQWFQSSGKPCTATTSSWSRTPWAPMFAMNPGSIGEMPPSTWVSSRFSRRISRAASFTISA